MCKQKSDHYSTHSKLFICGVSTRRALRGTTNLRGSCLFFAYIFVIIYLWLNRLTAEASKCHTADWHSPCCSMHKQTTCHLSLPCSPSRSHCCPVCLHLWRFFYFSKAHKFVLVACATFLLRIFIMCLSLPLFISGAATKSMLCSMPHSAYHLPHPLSLHAQRKSLPLRHPGANFIIYSLTRRDDDSADYVPHGEWEILSWAGLAWAGTF